MITIISSYQRKGRARFSTGRNNFRYSAWIYVLWKTQLGHSDHHGHGIWSSGALSFNSSNYILSRHSGLYTEVTSRLSGCVLQCCAYLLFMIINKYLKLLRFFQFYKYFIQQHWQILYLKLYSSTNKDKIIYVYSHFTDFLCIFYSPLLWIYFW
jgi:hypothetical protein